MCFCVAHDPACLPPMCDPVCVCVCRIMLPSGGVVCAAATANYVQTEHSVHMSQLRRMVSVFANCIGRNTTVIVCWFMFVVGVCKLLCGSFGRLVVVRLSSFVEARKSLFVCLCLLFVLCSLFVCASCSVGWSLFVCRLLLVVGQLAMGSAIALRK